VSGDIVQQAFDAPADPVVFLPYRQDSYDSMALLIRSGDNSTALSAVRHVVRALDQDLPLFEVSTLREAVARQFWFLRVFGTVFLVFAGIALVIASVGIYAVMAHATGRRTQEIGVRMALGATSKSILRLVLRRGVVQLGAGLGLGLLAAFPSARAMAALPFLSSPSDPTLFVAVGALLAAVGLFACWLPARRAAALHPVTAIRNE
jgi:ABC-type antimicrobial peptide transport system permease subunit